MTDEIRLPSGSVLKVGLAPFSDAKALKQAVLDEMRKIPMATTFDHQAVLAQAMLIGASSPRIEVLVWQCAKRCVIDGATKVTEEYFEPVEKRDDWLIVFGAILKANISPFLKSLWREFVHFLGAVDSFQKSKSATKT